MHIAVVVALGANRKHGMKKSRMTIADHLAADFAATATKGRCQATTEDDRGQTLNIQSSSVRVDVCETDASRKQISHKSLFEKRVICVSDVRNMGSLHPQRGYR